MCITKPSINLEDIKYFKDISSETVLEMLADILETPLSEESTADLKTRYRLCGITIELEPDYGYLDLKETIEFAESTINSIAKNRTNNQLEELYKATLLNTFIYDLLKDYLFFKRKDKELIKSKLVNTETIRTYLSWLNYGEGEEVFDLEDLNDKTIAVLKSTLEELGYEYKEKDNKLYIGSTTEDKDIEQANKTNVMVCTYIGDNNLIGV